MILHKLHELVYKDDEPPMYDLQFKQLPLPAPGEPLPLDLADRLIDDHMLSKCLPTLAVKWGQRLQHLSLEGTFITEKGLEHLKHCVNLRSLSVSRCRNLLDKEKSNSVCGMKSFKFCV